VIKLSSGNPAPSSQPDNPVEKIRRLLGDVVLIPVYPLAKKPIVKSWQRQTSESMQDPVYLRLFKGKNIGVSLGKTSGGLCTIDFDRDADIEPFLKNNPRLRDTTRTKRVRGCNLWIFIDGDYPPNKKLPFGEWRADGNQTVIYGSAIDTKKGEIKPTQYKFLNEVPPVHIRFDGLVFPDGCFEIGITTPPPTAIRLNPEICVTESLQYCTSTSLHNKTDSVLANIKASRAARDALAAKHPHLVRLYTEFIEPRYQAQEHARNGFIVKAVPFLYRAVAAQYVLELVGCFYDCNRARFNDSVEQHMKEAKAMLESVARTYFESLNAGERNIYEALSQPEQDAFRICRDLALLPEPKREPRTFFMSFNQLGDRLGIYPTQAQRIMRQLESYGLIVMVKKGIRRAAGVRGEAGIYQWLL
jgi:hypothetical protein